MTTCTCIDSGRTILAVVLTQPVGVCGMFISHVHCTVCRFQNQYVMFCRHIVLDEADQMLERGFADSVEEILAASFKDSE